MRFPAIVLAIALLLSGCTPPPNEPLQLGTNIWIGYEPLYVARARGNLPAAEVKLVEYLSASQTMQGLMDGAVDAAALTLDEALLLKQQGLDIQIVMVLDYSAGADALLARPGINSLEELKGKHIGVETTAVGAYLLQRALDKAGLKLGDITLVQLGIARHEQAYAEGAVDAVITFDPVRSRLLAKGANDLLDTRELPGEVVDVLVVRRDAAARHKGHLKTLLGAWFKTIAEIKKEPAPAAHAMEARMRLGQETILQALQGVEFPDRLANRQLLAATPPPLAVQAQRLADIMLQNQLLKRPVQATSLFDAKLLQESQ